MTAIRIDLASDTKTRPSPEMRRAMAEATVGDEQSGEDPTTNELCAATARLLGKESALFLPSGTMCNQIAILVHCRPGDEIICDRTSHIRNSEAGGPAALAGAMLSTLDGSRGIFSPDQARAAIRTPRRHSPRSRMIEVEQTSNAGGGTIWPLETLRALRRLADEHGLVVHMDGARLFDASVAAGVDAAAYAAACDTLWIDLSKGLGCPVGAVLAGSAEFIEAAWPWKQRLGGSMRQSGVIAAAGVYALAHNIPRLAEDHRKARQFAEAIANLPGIAVDMDSVQTNMVFFDVGGAGLDAPQVARLLAEQGVRIGAATDSRMRAVMHMDVGADQVAEAADILRRIVLERARAA